MRFRAVNRALLGLLLVAAVWPAMRLEAAAVAAGPDSVPVASAVRLGGDEAQTRFVMDVSRRIDLHAFTLADPYRVVVDISEVSFRLPPRTGESGRGLIKAFRFGLMMPGGSRLVFDLARPARVDKAFVVDATDGSPARLVLELGATDRDSFLRTIGLENKSMRADVMPPDEPAGAAGDARPLVMLDPGHGGIDNGTKAPSGELEKNIVLDFADALRQRLEKTGKYRVSMTRTDDTFIPLAERVHMARKAGASLFISLHADFLPQHEGDAEGATVYTLSDKATDAEAEHLAQEENRADVIAGVDLKAEPDDVADILVDLAQRETKAFSIQFAHRLVGEMKTATRLYKQPIKAAGFRVLRAPDIPSVLIELGYVSNKQDLHALVSDSWRDRTAEAMVKAIDEYFSTHLAGAHTGAN